MGEVGLGMFEIGGYTIPFVKSYVGLGIELLIILLLGMLLRSKRATVSIAFEMFFETMYDFFEEILGTGEKKRIKGTVVTIFFVVFFANMLGWLGDILAQGLGVMDTWFAPFSSDRNGVFAMSLWIVLFTLVVQLINIGPFKFIYEYLPIRGKDYLTIEQGTMKSRQYYPAFVAIKLCDIVISLFIGVLDVIGTIAKVISLAFRLYGNMIAGTTLLVLLVEVSSSLSQYLFTIDFPVFLPLILFVQGLLVAIIQAFVVALLTAIFVKMVSVTEEKHRVV